MEKDPIEEVNLYNTSHYGKETSTYVCYKCGEILTHSDDQKTAKIKEEINEEAPEILNDLRDIVSEELDFSALDTFVNLADFFVNNQMFSYVNLPIPKLFAPEQINQLSISDLMSIAFRSIGASSNLNSLSDIVADFETIVSTIPFSLEGMQENEIPSIEDPFDEMPTSLSDWNIATNLEFSDIDELSENLFAAKLIEDIGFLSEENSIWEFINYIFNWGLLSELYKSFIDLLVSGCISWDPSFHTKRIDLLFLSLAFKTLLIETCFAYIDNLFLDLWIADELIKLFLGVFVAIFAKIAEKNTNSPHIRLYAQYYFSRGTGKLVPSLIELFIDGINKLITKNLNDDYADLFRYSYELFRTSSGVPLIIDKFKNAKGETEALVNTVLHCLSKYPKIVTSFIAKLGKGNPISYKAIGILFLINIISLAIIQTIAEVGYLIEKIS
jgi:hypothetical protein